MVREGPDGGKGNKGRKSLKGVSPEKVGNALKAKTPEEEYIANCGAEIKDIEERVEENERALKELEKKLPSEEEKKEREMKAVEEFSIKKFSEFLSNEELEILKKGREYRELKKIVEENKYGYLIELIKASGKSDKFADLIVKDKYSDLIMKICEGIKDFSGEEKIVLATYLQNQNIILLGMDGNKYLGFYYTDFPEEEAFENEVRSNLRKLGINGFVSYVGDSCYRPDWGELDRIREKVIFEYLSDSDKEDRLEFDKLKKEGEKLGTELESIKERKHAVEKYGLPEKEAISLYQWSENLEWVHDEVYDKENHALVVLHEYSDYNGSGGSEYGTVISIKRGKNTTKKSFMYRDRYDAEYDNPEHEYRKINSVKVNGDKVEVTVSSGNSKDVYVFDIPYKEDEETLSYAEKKEFKESIRSVEEKLIIENTKDQKYLASHNFALRKIPGAFDGMNLGTELSYDKAKIVYEKLIPEKGEAHVTILMQKDASGDMGRQFGLIKYIVTPEGAKMVDEYFYWELNQMDGDVDKEKMEEFVKW